MTRAADIKCLLIALALLAPYTLGTYMLHSTRDLKKSDLRAVSPVLPPQVMKVLAGEFKGLASDVLLIEAAAFLGSNKKPTDEDYEGLSNLFSHVLALDPFFKQAYYLVQASLSWEGKRYDKANELLGVSRDNRRWDWVPGFFIGFNYFYFIKDNLEASRQLMEASKVPNAPLALATLASRLAAKSGQTLTAIVFLKAMLEKTEDEDKRKELELRIEALKGVLTLEQALERYRSAFGNEAQSLEELVTSGIIAELPINPYERPFELREGVISF